MALVASHWHWLQYPAQACFIHMKTVLNMICEFQTKWKHDLDNFLPPGPFLQGRGGTLLPMVQKMSRLSQEEFEK